ncbi:hypothetical protein DFS34DRAFT_683527 [Phlyctochytrium arcticum]|nr:hypothetical protein DFS34DRAFT_683527 [Phlyctochytrium arcticum]
MPPKKKRQLASGLVWYHEVPGKKGNKQVYYPGCIGCGKKSASRFHKLLFAELDSLKQHGVKPLLGRGIDAPWACEACRARWYRAGLIRAPIVPIQDADADAAPNEGLNGDGDGSDTGNVNIIADLDANENAGAAVTPTPETTQAPNVDPNSDAEYEEALRELVDHPFDGNPLLDIDGFAQKYRAYAVKARMIGFREQYSPIYNDRMKREVVFSVCYDGSLRNQKCDYIKRFFGHEFITASYTDQRFMSRMNLCYHPSKSITRQNDLIVSAQERVVNDILVNNPLLVITIDDFHWCQIRPVPDAVNAPGKFTSAKTTANYAVKLHREMPPLPPNIGDVMTSILQDSSWMPVSLGAPQRETYAEVRNGEILSKKMYAYSMATKAGSQEDFHIIGSDENPLKSALDLQPCLDNIQTFLAKVDYPGQDNTFSKSVILAGDFYVWMYASKLLRSPTYGDLRPHVLPVPDNMHTALNVQEAVLVHGWTIIHHLWIAGYPDVENTAPINMRPKRRTAMLALSMTAWQECRQELLSAYKLGIANNPKATPVRKAMVESILSLFEDHIPLAVDCPYLLSSGDLLQVKMCLKRLFPLFALLGEKNYVNIVLFQLGLLERLPSHLPEGIVMAFLFSTFSSEDLEVFHSILRAAIRFQDTNAQVARKAMLITAMRGESALMQLAAMTERELAIRRRPVAPIEGESVIKKEPGTSGEARSSAPTPLEKAADDVVPRMVAYLKELFSTLFAFSFDVVGQTDKLPYAAALPHYNLVLRPPRSRPMPSTPLLSTETVVNNSGPSSRNRNAVTTPVPSGDKENPAVNPPSPSGDSIPTVVLATIRESLVPLPLRRQPYINLGNHIDIEGFQSVSMPAQRSPLTDVTNGQSSTKAKKIKVREFLKTDCLNYDLTACGCKVFNCQCAAMYQWIATKSIEHFSENIDKSPVRGDEESSVSTPA